MSKQLVQVYTSLLNLTWLCPAGVHNVIVEGVGGGGGGGYGADGDGSGEDSPGGAGGGGARMHTRSVSVTPGLLYGIDLGAGGLGTGGNAIACNGSPTRFLTPGLAVLAYFPGGGGGSSSLSSYFGNKYAGPGPDRPALEFNIFLPLAERLIITPANYGGIGGYGGTHIDSLRKGQSSVCGNAGGNYGTGSGSIGGGGGGASDWFGAVAGTGGAAGDGFVTGPFPGTNGTLGAGGGGGGGNQTDSTAPPTSRQGGNGGLGALRVIWWE